MLVHTQIQTIAELAARGLNKWCLLLIYNGNKENSYRIRRDCRFLPSLPEEDQYSITISLNIDGWCLIECDNEAHCRALYEQVDGDDTGGRIYALTIDDTGQSRNENT